MRPRLASTPLFLLLILLTPTWDPGLGGQELPWLSAGRIRLDWAPSFWSWDSRYGIRRENGRSVGAVEPLGSDLTADPLGSGAIPSLRSLEAALAEALEDPGYRVRLGASQAMVDQALVTFPFRLEVGVTDWLTVGVMVPFVRPRTEIGFLLEADSLNADVGLTPAFLEAGAVQSFLEGFQAALQAAQQAHPGHPSVQEGERFLAALSRAYGHRSLFPAAGSASGARLQARLGEIRSSLGALGMGGVPTALPLAGELLDTRSFQSFLTNPAFGMRAAPLENFEIPVALGDVEISASVRLLSGGMEADSLGALPFFQYQLGVGGLLRLATGDTDDPDRYLDLGPGDGQPDLEGSVFGLWQAGSRFGGWGRVRYGLQMEGEILRRIRAPSEALPPWGTLAPLRFTPGNYLELDLNPSFVLAPGMTLGLRYRFWSKGADRYRFADIDPELLERVGYPPVALLEEETEQRLQEVGVSATFTSLPAHARGEASLPFHIRTTYFHPVQGSGGQTPGGARFEAALTLYRQLWGR